MKRGFIQFWGGIIAGRTLFSPAWRLGFLLGAGVFWALVFGAVAVAARWGV